MMKKWFKKWYWQFLLEDCKGWKHFLCRIRNHPNGPIYYNPIGTEPDYRCIDCGEHLN